MARTLEDMLEEVRPPETRTCDQHGDYTARNIFGRVWTQCPACREEHARSQREVERAERARRSEDRRRRRLANCGVPAAQMVNTLDTYDDHGSGPARALASMRRYIDDVTRNPSRFGRSIVLAGAAGTGKTHLATAAVLHAIQHDRPALYTTASRMCTSILGGWRDGVSTARQRSTYTDPALLAIDEVDERVQRDAWAHTFFDVIDERYARGKSTILVSNLGLSEVRDALGEQVCDRLREQMAKAVVFDWESRRGRAR